jgi:replication factor A1
MQIKIAELKPGMKQVDVSGSIMDVGQPRDVTTRRGDKALVAEATLKDDSGSVKLVVWDEQIDAVGVGKEINVENGYVTSFRGETQLNIGRYGRLTVK